MRATLWFCFSIRTGCWWIQRLLIWWTDSSITLDFSLVAYVHHGVPKISGVCLFFFLSLVLKQSKQVETLFPAGGSQPSVTRGSKVWTHSHTLDSLRKLRGSSWMQAEKGHTPGLLAVFITSTTWLFHSWLSAHLLPLREAGAGARAETREEPPDWLVPHGFLTLLSYTTQKQLSEVALPTVDRVLPHQSISNILHRPIW